MNTIALAIMFLNSSQALDLPPHLLESLCYVESKHVTTAIHPDDGGTDSLGICQIKLRTAKWLGFKGTEIELMKPETNIYYAAKYLRYQLTRYKSLERAIVAYNRGNAKYLHTSKYSVKVINQWRLTTNEQKRSGRRPAGI